MGDDATATTLAGKITVSDGVVEGTEPTEHQYAGKLGADLELTVSQGKQSLTAAGQGMAKATVKDGGDLTLASGTVVSGEVTVNDSGKLTWSGTLTAGALKGNENANLGGEGLSLELTGDGSSYSGNLDLDALSASSGTHELAGGVDLGTLTIEDGATLVLNDTTGETAAIGTLDLKSAGTLTIGDEVHAGVRFTLDSVNNLTTGTINGYGTLKLTGESSIGSTIGDGHLTLNVTTEGLQTLSGALNLESMTVGDGVLGANGEADSIVEISGTQANRTLGRSTETPISS